MSNVISFQKSFSYKIIVPDIDEQYDLNFGRLLSQNHITDSFISDFIEGRLSIDVLFPEQLEQYHPKCPPKILAEFFVGLLGPTIKSFRDKHFKETASQTNRNKMRDINQEVSIDDIISQTFGVAWEVCGDIEEALKTKIRIGIKENNGKEIYDTPIEEHPFLYHSQNKYHKALDILFMTNFNALTMNTSSPNKPLKP